MNAWRPGTDLDSLKALARLTAERVALSTITRLAPSLTQAAEENTPQVLEKYLQEQLDTRCAMIKALERENTTLRMVHNVLYPLAASLPSEILAEVFSYLHNRRPGTLGFNTDFFNAINTCSRWRKVACGVARFWTSIPLNNPYLLAASLERSRAIPLHLWQQGQSRNVQETGALLRPHTRRIKNLDIAGNSPEDLEVFFTELHGPAPKLEQLRIRYSLDGTNALPIAPPFGGDMPLLRTLVLDYALLSPGPSWTNNLQELEMTDTLPSLSKMLHLLEQCTSLRTLRVDGELEWDDDELTDHPVVSLPSLQRLHVSTSPIAICEDLLVKLSLPNNATLYLQADMSVHRRPVSLPDLRVCLHMPCIRGLKRIEVLWSGDTIFIRGFRKAEGDVTPDIEVAILEASDFLDLPDLRSLDRSQVEFLVVKLGGLGELTYDMLPMLLMFPNLKTLRMKEPDVASLLRLLKRMTEIVNFPVGTAGQQQAYHFCPLLHTLELFDFRWAEEIPLAIGKMLMSRQIFGFRALTHVDVHNAKGGPDGPFFIGSDDGSRPHVSVVMNPQ